MERHSCQNCKSSTFSPDILVTFKCTDIGIHHGDKTSYGLLELIKFIPLIQMTILGGQTDFSTVCLMTILKMKELFWNRFFSKGDATIFLLPTSWKSSEK